MNNISNIVVYNDGELELKVSVNEEMIWLNADEIAYIFNVNRPAIVKHIGNIYKDDELDKNSTCSILEQVAKDGKIRKINFYNLDIIISVGYRVNSKKATKFRQWANIILKNYIQNGYVINGEKVTNERFISIENEVNTLKLQMSEFKSLVKNNKLETIQGVFFDGQVYDAYSFVSDLIKTAKDEIVLLDNYIDDSILTLFSKTPNIKVTIYSNTISKQLKLDFEQYSKQYGNITLKTFKNSHDRFLIIDNQKVYHIGASIKDLGKRWFAFSKIDISANDLLSKLI